LVKFRAANSWLKWAIDDPSLLRIKFQKAFDTPVTNKTKNLSALYKSRKDLLNPNKVKFDAIHARRTVEVTNLLYDLILGSSLPACHLQY
jgi:hypothetical protein